MHMELKPGQAKKEGVRACVETSRQNAVSVKFSKVRYPTTTDKPHEYSCPYTRPSDSIRLIRP
jgi:hypothetical protein